MMTEKPRSPPVVSEHRKVTKSAMEKKRRARINSSLTELKSILAGIMTFKEEKFEKMEKADILEMTVNYVRQLQNKSVESDAAIHREGDNYRTGVNSCIGEVIRYMTASEVCDTDTKTKLLDHLANRVNNLSTTPKSPCLPSPQNDTVDRVNCTQTVDVPEADANNNVMSTLMVKQTSPISVCTASQKQFSSLQTIGAYTSQMLSPVNSLQSSIASVSVQNVQNINQVGQSSSQLMSNVPLTILVPANFCTTATGTTCVIPVTWSNPAPPESNVVFNPSICTIARDISQEQNDNNAITVTNVDRNTMDVDTDPGEPQKELRVSQSDDTNTISNITESPVNLSRSQIHECEVDVLQTKQQHHKSVDRVGGNTNSGVVDRVSENIPKSPTVSELPRSEYSVFQTYESRKSVSPFHRANSVWRPW